MAVTRARRLEILLRRQQVAELCLRSWTQTAIAQKLDVSQSTVSDDLKSIRKQWLESATRDFDEAVVLEEKQIERVIREAWAAWGKSKQPAESSKITTDGTDKKADRSAERSRHKLRRARPFPPTVTWSLREQNTSATQKTQGLIAYSD